MGKENHNPITQRFIKAIRQIHNWCKWMEPGEAMLFYTRWGAAPKRFYSVEIETLTDCSLRESHSIWVRDID